MDFGIATVAAITAICYLVGLIVKATPYNNDKYIPIACGICGGLLAPIFFLNNTMGATAGSKAFAAIVIGGFGSVPGAIIGGLIVGLVEQFGGAYISSTYQLVLIYVVLIIFLMFRPRGLFKEKIQEKA